MPSSRLSGAIHRTGSIPENDDIFVTVDISELAETRPMRRFGVTVTSEYSVLFLVLALSSAMAIAALALFPLQLLLSFCIR